MGKPKWMHPLFHGTPKEMPPFTPEEQEDPGPGATDHGSGPEFSRVVKDIDGRDMVLTDAVDAPWTWDPEASPKFTVTLPPEVLAQLQRIEDHLVGLRKTLEANSLPPGLGPQ